MQKGLIVVLIILAVVGVVFICKKADDSQKSQWTNRSEQLLKIKKMPKDAR